MSDWEISAPDDATMIAGGIAMGLLDPSQAVVPSLPVTAMFPNGDRVDVNFFGVKQLADGTTAPGVYAIMRFTPGPGCADFDPATQTGPGCKVIALSDPAYVQGVNEPVWG